MVTLKKCYTDGTKIEANANRYTFIWGKSIHTRTVKIAEQLNELWAYAEGVCKEELSDRAPITHTDITSDKIERLINEIDLKLADQVIDPKIKTKIKRSKQVEKQSSDTGQSSTQRTQDKGS